MPIIHCHNMQPPAHISPTTVYILAVLLIIRFIDNWFQYREKKVEKFLKAVEEKIWENNSKDMAHLPGPDKYMQPQRSWRMDEFLRIDTDAMERRFWKPLEQQLPEKLKRDLGIKPGSNCLRNIAAHLTKPVRKGTKWLKTPSTN